MSKMDRFFVWFFCAVMGCVFLSGISYFAIYELVAGPKQNELIKCAYLQGAKDREGLAIMELEKGATYSVDSFRLRKVGNNLYLFFYAQKNGEVDDRKLPVCRAYEIFYASLWQYSAATINGSQSQLIICRIVGLQTFVVEEMFECKPPLGRMYILRMISAESEKEKEKIPKKKSEEKSI